MQAANVRWRGGRISVLDGVVTIQVAGDTVTFPAVMLPDFKKAVARTLDEAMGDGWFDPSERGPFRHEADE